MWFPLFRLGATAHLGETNGLGLGPLSNVNRG